DTDDSISVAAVCTCCCSLRSSSSCISRLMSALTSATYRCRRPSRWPIVRAVFGSLSGPRTTSATTAMRTISQKPTSHIRGPDRSRPALAPRATPALRRLLLLYFAFDRRARDLLRWRGRRRVGLRLAALHSFLEALHRAPQVLADIAQLLRAEDQ